MFTDKIQNENGYALYVIVVYISICSGLCIVKEEKKNFYSENKENACFFLAVVVLYISTIVKIGLL